MAVCFRAAYGFKIVERFFGRDDPNVLVWNSDTASMNSSVPAHVIERAFEEDPIAAASEYGTDGRVVFRRDVEQYMDPLAILAVTVEGRRELEPLGVAGTRSITPEVTATTWRMRQPVPSSWSRPRMLPRTGKKSSIPSTIAMG